MIVKIIYYAFVAALLVGFSCLVAAISDKPFEDAFWQYFEMFLFLCITIKIANWADRKGWNSWSKIIELIKKH